MRRGLLATRDTLRMLKDRLSRKPFDAMHAMLQRRCSLILQTSPVTESQWRLLSQQGSTSAALNAARTTQGRLFDLLIAHHVSPNQAFRDRAIEELRNLLSWSTWVDPAHSELRVDLCTAESAVAAVVALDWLWEDIAEVDRLRVRHALRNKVIAPYEQSVKQNAWWYNCYHSWNAVINSGCGLAALALSDEESNARDAFTHARAGLARFLGAIGREGGWDEGLAYWGLSLRYVLLLAEGLGNTLDDLSLFHTRGIDATGLFPVYFTPNGQHMGFGDSAATPLYDALYLLTKRFGLKQFTWWMDTYACQREIVTTGHNGVGLAMLFRPVDAEVTTYPDMQNVKVFNEIGWAALADRWPRPTFYVATKTGDLSAHHGRPDMCSINLQVDGETMLVDRGLPPYLFGDEGEPNADMIDLPAASHNVLLVGRRDHRIDGQGQIVEAQADHEYRWVACDSGQALGDSVHAIRHLVMLTHGRTRTGTTLVVLDELAIPGGESVDLFWHSPAMFQRDGDRRAGVFQGLRARLYFGLTSTAPGRLEVLRRETTTRNESILHLHLPRAGKVLLASTFSRKPLHEPELRKSPNGDVRLILDNTELSFRSHKRHLQLIDVLET